MDPVTTKLIAVSSSTKVSNRVVVVMVTMVLSSKLLIKVMAINKLLKVKAKTNRINKIRVHRKHLRIRSLRILRLPPLLIATVTDTDMVSAATVVFPLFPDTKAMDTTLNRLLVNMDSSSNSNSSSRSRNNIPARTSTNSVSSMAKVLITSSRTKVMVVVDMLVVTEQVKCFLSKLESQ